MADFSKLDPETRAFAMVGQFLSAFSKMEKALDDAIGAALSITEPSMSVLSLYIPFRDKTYSLATLIYLSDGFSDAEKKVFKTELIRNLGEYSKTRNMVAHSEFEPDESRQGVQFLTIKAKGAFSLPRVVWLDAEIQRELNLISQYETLLGDIEQRLRNKPPDVARYWQQSRHDEPMQDPLSMPRGPSQSLLAWLSQQACQDSCPPNQE